MEICFCRHIQFFINQSTYSLVFRSVSGTGSPWNRADAACVWWVGFGKWEMENRKWVPSPSPLPLCIQHATNGGENVHRRAASTHRWKARQSRAKPNASPESFKITFPIRWKYPLKISKAEKLAWNQSMFSKFYPLPHFPNGPRTWRGAKCFEMASEPPMTTVFQWQINCDLYMRQSVKFIKILCTNSDCK